MVRYLLVLFFLCVLGRVSTIAQPERYEQAYSTRMTFDGKQPVGDWLPLDGVPSANLVQPILRKEGSAVILTPESGLFYLSPTNQLQKIEIDNDDVRGGIASMAAPSLNFSVPTFSRRDDTLFSTWDLVVASPTFFGRCTFLNLFSESPVELVCPQWTDTPSWNHLPITGVVMSGQTGDAWVGTSAGLYIVPGNSVTPTRITEIPEVRITSLALYDPDPSTPEVAVGTEEKLWRFLKSGSWYFWFNSSSFDSSPTALAFDSEGILYIGNNAALNVQNPDLTFTRFPDYDVPYGKEITSITAFGEKESRGLWVGTKWGLMRLDAKNNTGWRYFNGGRWLSTSPDSNPVQSQVVSVCGISGLIDEVLVATDYGLTRIAIEWWTLRQKADLLDSQVPQRHLRYGLTSLCSLGSFGNLSSWSPTPSDNDGLWTSIYLGSQAYRYAATYSNEAAQNANRSLNALLFLQKVTGQDGYPARSYGRQGDPGTDYQPNHGQHTWFNSTSYPGWVYKSDTSSDEIVGHMYGISHYHDFIATSEGERRVSMSAIKNITSWISENGYTLVSNFGETTTWGIWSPSYINGNASWYEQRGLNSLQMLSWLKLTTRLTQDSQYYFRFLELADQSMYKLNIINQKLTASGEINYSDDELAWMSYAIWIQSEAEGGPLNPNLEEFSVSLNRTIGINHLTKSALYNFIYLSTLDSPTEFSNQLLDDAIWCLQSWPLEQIDWPVHNSHRSDIIWSEVLDDQGDPQTLTHLRYDELAMFRWNSNPFRVDGGSGFSEYDPSAFLLPYWMGVYHKLISPE